MTSYKIRIIETSALFTERYPAGFRHRQLVYIRYLEKDRLRASVVKQKVFTLFAFSKTLVL